jgi:2-C-methyl-D-erythritol 4-phosphate cytidylyltransferase
MNVVLIPASGVGKRMGGDLPKQFSLLAGKPILAHTLEGMQACPVVDAIVIAAQAEHHERIRGIATEFGITKLVEIVDGGDVRQDSVWNALKASPAHADFILVHDAVRPLVSHAEIIQVLEAAKRQGAAILAVPVKDTIKQADEHGFIENTLDREYLWCAQTPQAFRREVLVNAYKHAMTDHYLSTDEASLVEYSGGDVKIIEGSWRNIKITTPEDVIIAESLLQLRIEN